MSIKIALLKSGETIISDIREIVSENSEETEEKKEVYGYIFSDPQKVFLNTPILVSDNDETDEASIRVSFSPWIILSKDKNILVPRNWVVTFVEPIESVKTMYENKVNGSNN